MSQYFGNGSNYKRRRFQATGFGLNRDVSSGDALPVWKKQMFARIRNKSKQHRQSLLQRLEQQKNKNHNLSPNTKKLNANNTIDSFKKALVEHEMKQQFDDNNNNNNKNGCFYNEAKDIEHEHLTNDQYKAIFAELARYLEDTELADLRASYVASLEEIEKDEEINVFEEIMADDAAKNPHTVYCPICCKHEMEIEYINNNQPVYSCLCGIKFQPNDKNVTQNNGINNGNNWYNESDVDIGHRMLKALKNNLCSLMKYHSEHLQCKKQLNFAVIKETGYLQAWCCQCNCNEIVI